MCGIAGIIGKNSPTLGQDLVNMLKELVHRGRDATGVAVYEQREGYPNQGIPDRSLLRKGSGGNLSPFRPGQEGPQLSWGGGLSAFMKAQSIWTLPRFAGSIGI